MKTRNRWKALNLWLALGFLILLPVSAVVGQGHTGLDPVVTDVIEMLNAGVDEEVIARWLESTDRRPTDIARQGMIALSNAGASEQLISTLLQSLERREPEPSELQAPIAAVTTSDQALDSEEPVWSGSEASEGSVEAIFQLRAKRAFTEEPEPDWQPEEPWDIYLYLDGELVAWTRPSLEGEPVEARRMMGSGRRELRIVLQRYQDLRGGWLYESLSVPTLFAFEAHPGQPIEIEVEMKRIWGLWRDRKDGGPLTYIIRQGTEVLAEHQGTGGNPDRWQPVCEDVEANFADTRGVPKRFRNAMSRCVRWSELWAGAGQSTSRSDILAALAEYDFRPRAR